MAIQAFFGTKLGMTHSWSVSGDWVAATRLNMAPMKVTQIKNIGKDGYNAVQFGFGRRSDGHERFIREARGEAEEKKVGDSVKIADIFSAGDKVKVTGTTKGKGFTGVVKRWGFSGGPRTHGQSDRHRAPGSIGQGTTPGRVYKGKKMAGRSGSSTKTVSGLKVVRVDPEKNEVWVGGAVPGAKGGVVKVQYETKCC
jgi:large subunit ribosomal protein L3